MKLLRQVVCLQQMPWLLRYRVVYVSIPRLEFSLNYSNTIHISRIIIFHNKLFLSSRHKTTKHRKFTRGKQRVSGKTRKARDSKLAERILFVSASKCGNSENICALVAKAQKAPPNYPFPTFFLFNLALISTSFCSTFQVAPCQGFNSFLALMCRGKLRIINSDCRFRKHFLRLLSISLPPEQS